MKPRALMYHDSAAGELHRQQRKVDQSESLAAQRDADLRNLALLESDPGLLSVCRGYFMADAAGRERMAEVAREEIAAAQARSKS